MHRDHNIDTEWLWSCKPCYGRNLTGTVLLKWSDWCMRRCLNRWRVRLSWNLLRLTIDGNDCQWQLHSLIDYSSSHCRLVRSVRRLWIRMGQYNHALYQTTQIERSTFAKRTSGEETTPRLLWQPWRRPCMQKTVYRCSESNSWRQIVMDRRWSLLLSDWRTPPQLCRFTRISKYFRWGRNWLVDGSPQPWPNW
jgi:hypothetical protein